MFVVWKNFWVVENFKKYAVESDPDKSLFVWFFMFVVWKNFWVVENFKK